MSDPTVRDVGENLGSQATMRDVDASATVREAAVSATMREADTGYDATVREDQGTSGRREAGGSSAGFLRLPEGLAARYRIERELPTRGNEADLFVVLPVADGAEVVVKLYRANVHPKDEVLTRIAALDRRHVIRQIEHGISEGRSYEVIEYAASGSLADLMRETRFDGAMLTAMIAEVTAGLGYLHSLDPPIVHRDVKPDNILVRGREPLDLVMTDFGLSSVLEGGSWRASTLDRTIKYAAPEASAGQVSREMDWWSLGMMVAEAFRGLHPFAGVAEQTIGIHYSNRRPVPLDGIDDERVKRLCQGLLCYDRKQRWGADEVGRWLAGDTSLRAPVEEVQQAVGVPFKFANGTYGTMQALAAAMAGNWAAAQRTVARADGLLAWLKDEAKEYEAWQWLSEIAQEKAQLDAGLKVALLLPMLDPSLPVMFEGEALTPERLLDEVSAAVEGTDSARTARLTQLWEHLPALAELSPGAAWLGEAHAGVERARKEADELVKALGSDAPKIAATNTWAFIRDILANASAPEALATALEAVEGLLGQLSDDAEAWIEPLKAADRTTTGTAWLVLQLEPDLRKLLAEMERRAVAEAAARIVAEQAAAILNLQDDLRDAGWTLTPRAGHPHAIRSVAITPDGCHLVTVSNDHTAQLWELSTGRELRTFIGHTNSISTVAITPDGRHMVTGSIDITARLWDLTTGLEVRAFTGHTNWVTSIAVTPDGRHLVTGSNDKSARLWDIATGQQLRVFTGHTERVCSVAVTPDGRHLVTGSEDKSARLWDIATARELRAFTGNTGWVDCLSITSDGQYLITGGYKNDARLWDLATGRELRAFIVPNTWITSIAITPDGRHLVTGLYGKTARLWEIATGRELHTFTGHTDRINSVAVTPDGHNLVTGSFDHTARLWDLATGQELRTFKGYTSGVNSQAVTSNGEYLATTDSEYTVRLYGLAAKQELRTFKGHTGQISSVAISPDKRYLITGSHDRTVRLWDLTTSQELCVFIGHTDKVLDASVTPDGCHLVTRSCDATTRFWNLTTGQELRTSNAPTGSVTSVAITSDRRYLATGGKDNIARLWDLATEQELRTFKGHTDQINSVAISPDGHHLITGSGDKTVRLWDLATGQELRTFSGHRLPVKWVTVTPDGCRVAGGGADQSVRLWDINTGRLIQSMILANEYGRLTFGPNGELDHIDGDPNALLHFVRGMEVVTATEILGDGDETWRQKPAASDVDEPSVLKVLPQPSLDPKFEPEVNAPHSPSSSTTPVSPELEPVAMEQQGSTEQETLPFRVSKPSMIPAFIRKLFQ